MPSPIGNEAGNFIRAYKAIHGLLAVGSLAPDGRALIEFSAIDLLGELQPEELGRNCLKFSRYSLHVTPTCLRLGFPPVNLSDGCRRIRPRGNEDAKGGPGVDTRLRTTYWIGSSKKGSAVQRGMRSHSLLCPRS